MLTIPGDGASDDEWYEYAQNCCEILKPHLADFLTEQFSYKPRYVNQMLWRSGSTISAFTRKYDLYFRVFLRPQDFWPRECIILARLMFKEQRVGHGRGLVEMFVSLAPKLGYKFLAIECANKNAAAFGKRMGFTPYEAGRHWVGSISDIQQALAHSSRDSSAV
ncbi:hypothetical protein LLY42_24940 [Pseudomonas frederiksbergensis]|uniref:hypothetical protein n=1 Tax=Pseudomonas cucumis TaxID=2954082 RepID=UPI002186BE64|nr:hypothetical protein [Pseudomonas cucumis]URM27069.1 hypothetical protein LLY42_24940 [Pseudomonas frederiksbergensis]WLG92516.1 hypothetical protein PSH72_10725 [Pseudomonas cucumis]